MQMYAPNSYSGFLYGIPSKIADDLLSSENDVITVLDTTGAKEMKEKLGNQACAIFIHTPLKVIESRLKKRGVIRESLSPVSLYLWPDGLNCR